MNTQRGGERREGERGEGRGRHAEDTGDYRNVYCNDRTNHEMSEFYVMIHEKKDNEKRGLWLS